MKLVINVGQVYTFKLTSGEELIAKVMQDQLDDQIVIQDPVSVAPGPQGLGLVPSMFTADLDTSIRINTNNITLYALTEDGVKMKYIEATTGIKVPEKKLILG
jgi:hypothetical protein